MALDNYLWKSALTGAEDLYEDLARVKSIIECGDIHAEELIGSIRLFQGPDNNPFAGYPLLAALFPQQKLALVTDEFQEIPLGQGKLASLGYLSPQLRPPEVEIDGRIARQSVLASDYEYLNSQFIRALRSKRNPWLHAFDARGAEILRRLAEGTDRCSEIKIDSFNFGIFSPRDKEDEEYIAREPFVKRAVGKRFSLLRDKLEEDLEESCKGLRYDKAIGLLSVVNTREGEMHIPMIDFKSRNFMEVAVNLQSGMLVASGNSYHFYGFRLMTPDEWKKNMHGLEINSYWNAGVDHVWAKIQLEEGYSMLRITPASTRPFQPAFIGET